ncbi:MAG TPA: hypothetical protein VLD37_03230 [Candidatus Bilamarchaeum sp.]|nr:hypothetical protein [Candidatus Bilamarchaeum sp.]
MNLNYKTQSSRDKRLREDGFDSASSVNRARAHRSKLYDKMLPSESIMK